MEGIEILSTCAVLPCFSEKAGDSGWEQAVVPAVEEVAWMAVAWLHGKIPSAWRIEACLLSFQKGVVPEQTSQHTVDCLPFSGGT